MTTHHSLVSHPANTGRRAGILLPLFSIRTENDWGIGDFSGLEKWLKYAATTGSGIFQILPINEMPAGQDCPYTALSAFALDPIYIAVPEVEEITATPAAAQYLETEEIRGVISGLRNAEKVDYAAVRELKFQTLWMGFHYFYENQWKTGGKRAKKFAAFREENAWWLDDYALFRYLKDAYEWKSWMHWPEAVKNREGAELSKLRAEHEKQILFFEYLQWIAQQQWDAARKTAAQKKIMLFGDLPFMINQESADVWANRDTFDVTREIGAPPDQFSTEGQRWGLPAYNWPQMQQSDFRWWRQRVVRGRQLYDLFRLDHLVGFFRTWVIPHDKSAKADFDQKDETLQQQRGEAFLRAVIDEAYPAMPVAEDLGVIPDFVRETLKKLHIPGYKVTRWEKDLDKYRDPDKYPHISLATTSTHDTEMMAEWWGAVPEQERNDFWRMLTGENAAPAQYGERERLAVLRRIMNSSSSMALFPVQDILGLADRINTPGTVGDHNWTYRLPFPLENCKQIPDFTKRMKQYKDLVREAGRSVA